MGRKISEIEIIEEGSGKYTLKLDRSDFLAIKFGLLEGVENPKKFFIFPSGTMSIYTTKEVDEFNSQMEKTSPNLVEFTNGKDESSDSFNAAKMEWMDLSDDQKWMLLKIISYFGSDHEILRMKQILKSTDAVFFDWVNKTEFDEITKELKGFGAKIKDLINISKMKPESK